MDKIRQEFEAWIVRCHHSIERNPNYHDDYKDVRVQYAWQGWKASRSDMCFKLHWNCKGMSLTECKPH